MVDTEASALGFVSGNYAKQHKLSTIVLAKSIRLRLAEDISALDITRVAQVKIQLGDHVEELWCMIANIGPFDLIVGWPWIEQHGVIICGKNKSLVFDSEECLKSCTLNQRPARVYATRPRPPRHKDPHQNPPQRFDQEANIATISARAFLKMASREQNQVISLWPEHFAQLDEPEDSDKRFLCSAFVSEIAALISEDYEKFFNKADRKPYSIEQLRERLPEEFRDFVALWDPKEANKVPPHRNWDHKIDLISGAKPPAKKAYGLERDQATVVKRYVDDMLRKGYIKPSISDYASSVLIVKKPDDGLRVCVDYRALNALTIKNRNAPPLVRETLARLCGAKWYTKLDIIAAFNEIRVREGDQDKTIFLTR